jgi:hypothetical protein
MIAVKPVNKFWGDERGKGLPAGRQGSGKHLFARLG